MSKYKASIVLVVNSALISLLNRRPSRIKARSRIQILLSSTNLSCSCSTNSSPSFSVDILLQTKMRFFILMTLAVSLLPAFATRRGAENYIRKMKGQLRNALLDRNAGLPQSLAERELASTAEILHYARSAHMEILLPSLSGFGFAEAKRITKAAQRKLKVVGSDENVFNGFLNERA